MKRISWMLLVAINFFWLGLNFRNNAVGSIFMPYLVEKFANPDFLNTSLGALRFAGLIVAMLVQPAAGLLSDRSVSRFGRRRPFIFWGVLLDLVFLGFIALSWNYFSLLSSILLIQVSSNISHGPLQALIPDLVPENQRGVASALKAIFELLPLVLLGITVAPLVANGHLGWAIIATAFGLLLIMLFTIIFVKEAPVRNQIETPLKPEMLRVLGVLTGIVFGGLAGVLVGAITGGIIGIGVIFFSGKSIGLEAGVFVGGAVAMVSAIIVGVLIGARATLGDQVRIYPRFVWWIINRLMFLAAITSIQGFAPYFLMYAFKVSSETAAGMTGTLVTVVGICTLISALPAGWLADRFGVTRLISLSGILGALGTVILLTSVWAPSLPIIYIAGLILGLSTGLFVTTNWALGTILAPDEKAGLFLGVSNLAGAGAGMIGSGIGGPIADFLNSSQHGLGYFAIFSSYALLFMLSSLVLRKVK